MSERVEALRALDRMGVLGGICWAWASARRQIVQTFDPRTGHDQSWVGHTALKLFRDRLDRVFTCGPYRDCRSFGLPGDERAAGLSPWDVQSMPRVAPGAVVRDDLDGSPGWRAGDTRIVLEPFGDGDGDGDRIPWPRRSWTGRRAAEKPPAGADSADMTLVAAYSIDAVTGASALYLGRPRGAGAPHAWHWREVLNRS